MEPVAYFLRLQVDEVKLGRVGEPASDQRCRLLGSRAHPEAGRDEGPKFDTTGEALRERRRVLSGDRFNEPRPDRTRPAASLGLTTGAAGAAQPQAPVTRIVEAVPKAGPAASIDFSIVTQASVTPSGIVTSISSSGWKPNAL